MNDEFDVPLDDEQALTAQDTPAEVIEEMNRESAEASAPEPDGALPPDIEAIWGDSPIAHALVNAWGIDVFRASELHSIALLEVARDSKLDPLRKAFVKEHSVKAPRLVDDVIPEPEEIK